MRANLSTRAGALPASQIRKLVPFADEAKAKGIRVYHLNIGQPDIETDAAVLSVLHSYKDKVIAYSPSRGEADYVDTLLRYYRRFGVELSREQLNVTTGGSEALLFAFMLTLNPGDELLIPEPFYTNYRGFACMAGVKVVPITTYGADGFHLPSRAVFEKHITPKTKGILLCNPSNPTGTVYSREEVDMVASLVEEHGLWLYSDEVYREFVFDAEMDWYLSALQLPRIERQVVVVDSISKRFSMCGARLGCLVSRNTELMEAALRLAQARLSSPRVAQAMAVQAHLFSDDFFPNVVGEYRKRRDVVFEALSAMPGVEVTRPEGAFYLIPKLPIQDTEHFTKWLLTDFSLDGETLMLSPASGFYATEGLGVDEVRIAYVLNTQDLQRAMHLLQEALHTYNS